MYDKKLARLLAIVIVLAICITLALSPFWSLVTK